MVWWIFPFFLAMFNGCTAQYGFHAKSVDELLEKAIYIVVAAAELK